MIHAYTWPTPNGHKVHIMLEECGLEWECHGVNIGKGEQFEPEFLHISPNNRIPAIVDTDGPDGAEISVFETGAILVYLAHKTGQLLPSVDSAPRAYFKTMEWLMWQMGGIGPMMGQSNHFISYAPDEIEYALNRYRNEVARLFGVADKRLGETAYLGDDDYSVADIACFPWMRGWERHGVPIDKNANVQRWLDAIAAAPGGGPRARGAQGRAPVRTAEGRGNGKFCSAPSSSTPPTRARNA